jgi:hypothetical protein
MNFHYRNQYQFSNQGGGGGVSLSHFINPAVLSTSLMVGGESESEGNSLFIPGGLILSENEPREYVVSDPFSVPVIMDAFDDLLDLVEVKPTLEKPKKNRITKKKNKKHQTK